MERTRKTLAELLGDALKCPRLSEWEERFVADMQTRLDTLSGVHWVSDRQWVVLEEIEAKVYGT